MNNEREVQEFEKRIQELEVEELDIGYRRTPVLIFSTIFVPGIAAFNPAPVYILVNLKR